MVDLLIPFLPKITHSVALMGKLIDAVTGVWSATPTPLTESREIDFPSVARMVEHHLKLGVKGLFVGGTCGEGPWLPSRQKHDLLRAVVEVSAKRMPIAAQVSDNSPERILENIDRAASCGVDYVVISHPQFVMNATPERLRDCYGVAVEKSPLPVALYDLGDRRPLAIPEEFLGELYANPKVHFVKDSSNDPKRREIALKARQHNSNLRLFNGDEFNCVTYIEAGYDGLMLGGAIFNGKMANKIIDLARAGDIAAANAMQERMTEAMYAVYGRKTIDCWLSGLKHLLVRMGVFSTRESLLGYPLTDYCIEAIDKLLVEEAELLCYEPRR